MRHYKLGSTNAMHGVQIRLFQNVFSKSGKQYTNNLKMHAHISYVHTTTIF
jgi:hypothetical protein